MRAILMALTRSIGRCGCAAPPQEPSPSCVVRHRRWLSRMLAPVDRARLGASRTRRRGRPRARRVLQNRYVMEQKSCYMCAPLTVTVRLGVGTASQQEYALRIILSIVPTKAVVSGTRAATQMLMWVAMPAWCVEVATVETTMMIWFLSTAVRQKWRGAWAPGFPTLIPGPTLMLAAARVTKAMGSGALNCGTPTVMDGTAIPSIFRTVMVTCSRAGTPSRTRGTCGTWLGLMALTSASQQVWATLSVSTVGTGRRRYPGPWLIQVIILCWKALKVQERANSQRAHHHL